MLSYSQAIKAGKLLEIKHISEIICKSNEDGKCSSYSQLMAEMVSDHLFTEAVICSPSIKESNKDIFLSSVISHIARYEPSEILMFATEDISYPKLAYSLEMYRDSFDSDHKFYNALDDKLNEMVGEINSRRVELLRKS